MIENIRDRDFYNEGPACMNGYEAESHVAGVLAINMFEGKCLPLQATAAAATTATQPYTHTSRHGKGGPSIAGHEVAQRERKRP